MEYQKAQHEMLRLKHKIIPIVLEDISEVKNLDKNLKSILNSVTYLEWPGNDNSKKLERFWKKLELSLPKKSYQASSSTCTSETSSASAQSRDILPTKIDCPVNSSLPPSFKASSDMEERSLNDSPTLSSATTGSSSPKFQKKRKDFKHFMEKLVRTKFFKRQDSNSSQSALMDAETLASRSSCGSVTESMLTESSEPPSPCSSPGTPRANPSASNSDNNAFFPIYANVGKVHLKRSIVNSKELVEVCEKDHCEDSECLSCRQQCNEYKHNENTTEGYCQDFLNHGFVDDENSSVNSDCEYCRYEYCRSDNNRIRISAVSDKLKIQKLSRVTSCEFCDKRLSRNPYRGSVKHCKDAANELVRQKRVGSLPRNYKHTQILKASTLDCRNNSDGKISTGASNLEYGIYVNTMSPSTGLDLDSELYVNTRTKDELHVYANTGPNGTCFMDVCESV